MDLDATLVAPCSPEHLFSWVEDLRRYPEWLEIVTRAEPIDGGAWAVDLRGRLGPLARSKRLRMVRSRHEAPTAVRFERAEVDGREHSPWVLEADVAPCSRGAELTMRLHYGGGLFGPVLERVLRDEIERSRHRLLALVSDPAGPGAR
ncbi:MAG: SRPBCC family protein [Acidimicrobiales bacterium]|nr:SRPBCC family protein [Actinomycetota bacterium]